MGKVGIYSEVLVCSIRVKLTWKCLFEDCLPHSKFIPDLQSLTWAMTHTASIRKLSSSNIIRSAHFSDYSSWNVTPYNLTYCDEYGVE